MSSEIWEWMEALLLVIRRGALFRTFRPILRQHLSSLGSGQLQIGTDAATGLNRALGYASSGALMAAAATGAT